MPAGLINSNALKSMPSNEQAHNRSFSLEKVVHPGKSVTEVTDLETFMVALCTDPSSIFEDESYIRSSNLFL